jgi:hypothetical protein
MQLGNDGKRWEMRKTLLATAATVLLISGCSSQSTVLQQNQPRAIDAAEKRAQFDFNCPGAKGEVLSSDYIQPAVSGGRWMAVQGVTRLEYTVGVEGCGKKEVFVVMCQEGTSSCFASLTRQTAGQ